MSVLAAKMGERPALKLSGGEAVSYKELDSQSNRLAKVLRNSGLRYRDVLGIVHDKSSICYAAMIAALKLGAAYVNIDDQNPAPRLTHIFESARPKIVIGRDLNESVRFCASSCGALPIDVSDVAFQKELGQSDDSEVSEMELVTGEDPAYIMYTSGSTGVPKGALISHANVLNFGAWVGSRFGIRSDDVFTNLNPMYFDNSVFDFYGALLNGAALAPVTRKTLANGSELMHQIEDASCSVWFSVPSLLIYLMTMKLLQPNRLATVRSFVFGGEGYPKAELRKLYAAFGSRSRLINVYGPTECTCICSAWDVRREDLVDEGLVTLGPIAENFSAIVLDDSREVPSGSVGELCLLGPQVGLGYANDSERTSIAFPLNPLNVRWPERMYRTGDLVRLGDDGRRLDFIGRKDNQIKHMGYRIELEEIEAALNRIGGVLQSAVVHKSSKQGQKMIVAYVSVDAPLDEAHLREQMEQLLPAYMIPQRFDIRASLPKNANGKIDKIALLDAM
ncbi:MAG: amino acid adenylation domain-containing protein [Candidatus Eremiobacteraeota bacterium]|nr:amino acid adenylation domain-containing protein [Candidatus Eremiobacteraeota bacterium]